MQALNEYKNNRLRKLAPDFLVTTKLCAGCNIPLITCVKSFIAEACGHGATTLNIMTFTIMTLSA